MRGGTQPPVATGAPSAPPLQPGEALSVWTVADVAVSRGDVHVVRADGDVPIRAATFKYRGAEPLPRFLEHLKADGDRWKKVRHPNLMPTLETGRLPSSVVCYWAQEDVPGELLAERIAAHAPFAPHHALVLVRQIGTALTVVHRAELVHGDVSAENVVLLDGRERLRLAWGGLATRLEAAGMNVGRPSSPWAELSPETLLGVPAGPATDVWGLSALLYRMLSGQPAYTPRRGGPPHGVSPAEPLPPLPGWVPRGLIQLLSEGLASEPRERPDLFEFLDRVDDLETLVRGAKDPVGTWAPGGRVVPEPANTPPTVNRTIEPRDDPDSDTSRSLARDFVPPPPPPPPPAASPPPASRPAPTGPVPIHEDPVLQNERPTMPPAAVPAPPPRVNPVVVGGVAVIALALVVLLVVILQPGPSPTEGAHDPGGAAAAASPGGAERPGTERPGTVSPGATASAPPVRHGPAILALASDPPSAEVWEGSQFLGLTPLEVTLEATGTREFELKLRGYLPAKVSQPWSEVDVRHSVALRPAAAAQPKPAPKPVPAAPAPALKGTR